MSDLVERLRKNASQWRQSDAYFSDDEADLNIEAASRISQQDAELERVRRELADMTISRDGYAKQAMAREAEGRRKAFIEAATLIDEGFDRGIKSKRDTCSHGKFGWEDCDGCCAAALRAKTEETWT